MSDRLLKLNPHVLVPVMTEQEEKEWNEKVARYDAEELKKQRYRAFLASGVDEKYIECSFDNFEVTTEKQNLLRRCALTFCDFVKKGKVTNLLLTGDCGAGKTHIAIAVIRHLTNTKKGEFYEMPVFYKCRYTTVAELNDRLISASNFKSKETRKDVFSDITDCDVLVLDEVDRILATKEKASDLMFEITDICMRRNISMVLISNKRHDELLNMLNKATNSRLQENKKLLCFDTNGIPDYRNRG